MAISLSGYNAIKANFASLYVSPTPIPYFAEMRSVGYVIPQEARPVFQQLITRLAGLRGRPPRVLDIGSSYGINACLLRYELSLDDVYRHYASHAHLANDSDRLSAIDRAFLRAQRGRVDAHFTGLDSSAPAIAYATAAGVLDDGFPLDLDADDRAVLPDLDVDLIISTGTVGYVGPGTFARVLDACSDVTKVRVATFALRMVDFAPYAKVMLDRGLATEMQPVTFVQRNMVSAAEMNGTIDYARSSGLSVDGLESTGRLFANLYLSRAVGSGKRQSDAFSHTHEHFLIGH